jgi:DNA-binding Lrp family transcriptional regulator
MVQYHPKDEMKRSVRAFIYLAASLGREKDVAEALWKLPEVKEVHIVPGKYDVMAVVEVPRRMLEPDSQSIYWFILDRIKSIGHIENTETLIPIVSMSKWSK